MKSYWIENLKSENRYKSLKKDIETDICIIGGGITGVSIAYYLNQYKIKNVLLEKDEIGNKATGGSTAKITSQHGLFYKYLIDSEGENFAKKYYEANEEAISNIEKIIKEENIECEFERESSYVFTQSIDDVQKIKDEVEAVNKIGGKARLVEAYEIKIPLKVQTAIEFPNQAQFNPYKYVKELAKICSKRHTDIYENSKVVNLEDIDNRYLITLDNGNTVKAKYVIIATKYPIINFPGLYFLKMYQSTSNAIVVDPKEDLFDGMYINSETPTISLRTIQNGDKKLLLVAGFDHKTGANIDLQDSYNYLEKVAKGMYPKCEVLYRWNTEDTISLDKIPYIGEFSNLMPRVYVATGFKKWGITSSNVAANIIVDKIMGNENVYEDIFKATRMEPVKNIKEVGNMVKESVYSLVLHKLEIPKETLEQIQKDHGKVVEIEGKKVGVYKDSQGKLFKVRPICMHLGCELNWNNLDKTWDCPCHGSRYTYKGELIYGPSVRNLETYE